ncbi:MAG: hypothetical protein LBF85_11290 [Tannerella sp.]|jgi:hypothetical protein|nr:hypothetical protein [Tannerella sp.]
MSDITFEIKKNIGTLSKNAKGWAKELNVVSWNGREPKYDIREWSPEHDKMGKGLTFTEEELKALKPLLESIAES